MVYYKLVKVIIDTPRLVKVIIDMVICYYGILELIVMNQGLLFISKFWSLLYYFLRIKKCYLQPFIYKQMVKPRDRIIY